MGSDAVGSRRRALRSSLHLIPFPCSPSHDVRRCEDRPWHQRPRCLEQCREEEREKRQERSRHEADDRSGEGSSEDEREREQEKEEKQKDRRPYMFFRRSFRRVVRSEQGSLRAPLASQDPGRIPDQSLATETPGKIVPADFFSLFGDHASRSSPRGSSVISLPTTVGREELPCPLSRSLLLLPISLAKPPPPRLPLEVVAAHCLALPWTGSVVAR